jgi:hypothetical protein
MPKLDLLSFVLVIVLIAGCGAKESSPAGTPSGANVGGGDSALAIPPPAKPAEPVVKQQTGLVLVQGNGNLGEADYGEKRSTSFTVKNATGKAVTLEVAEKSCECAGLEIKPAELPADGTGTVTMSWIPKLAQTPESGTMIVKLTATLQAREQPEKRLRLEASGRIVPALYVSLPRGILNFGRIQLGDLKAGNKHLPIIIYTTDPKRKGFTLEAKSGSPGIKLDPPPKRLVPADLNIVGAVDGFRINLKAIEGLPVGTFRELVHLKSDVYPDHPLEVSVEGFVESGAASIAPTEVISLPEKINIKDGYKCPSLTITLNFEPGRTLELVSVEPAFLKVTQTKVAADTWRIDVEVPPGMDTLLRMVKKPELLEQYIISGFEPGAITFKTNHKQVPVLKIGVPDGQLVR